MWLTPTTNKAQAIHETPSGLNGRISAKLNCIFKIQLNRGDIVYRLAYIIMTTIVSVRMAAREEGIVKVQLSMLREELIVNAREIAGMAHLIPIEPNKVWYINNRIDLYTWNLLYDN